MLLLVGDLDGATNRAYYAMFDAARAVLMQQGHEIGKTHRGVLTTFSEHIVKVGLVPTDWGRLLKQAETRRYVADYEGDQTGPDDALQMVEQAESLVAAMQQRFFSDLR